MSDSLQAALNEIVYIVRSSSLKRKYFVYGPTAQLSYDRKELWEMIKNDSDIYARIVADTGLAESAIEERVFKLFLNVPSVDVDEDVEVSGDADKCSLHTPYSKLPVHTTPLPKKITNLDGSYKYVCRHCGKVFCDFLSRENHIRFERHKIGDGLRKIKELFPCEKCGIELDSKENLFCHMEMHIDRKSRTKHASDCPKCDHCHSVFTLKRSLDRHMLLVHDEHGRPKYRCEDCDKTFCTGKQLETHNKQTHTDHICTSCEQRFTTKRALEHHQKKQETFYCSVCEKKFCNKKTFYGHIYNHKVK